MNTLIFSDTHLTDRFDEDKFDFLYDIIEKADQVIINGDLWEGWKVSFSEFVNSSWNKLFPLLKSRNAIYLWGNHDSEDINDARASLFSNFQGYQFDLPLGDRILHIEHGDKFKITYKLKPPMLGGYMSHPNLVSKALDAGEIMSIKMLHRNMYAGINRCYVNRQIKKQIEKKLASHAILVCGHTHAPELDLKNRFINSGMIRNGIAQYITISNETIELIKGRYK